MKFLSGALDSSNLMILNTYYDKGTDDFSTPDDVLDIVYKDMDTGKKYVETIHSPRIEVYVVKPEYRTFTYMRNFIDYSKCDKLTVPYKTRFAEVAKVLNCTPKEAQYSPYLFQGDMDIEHFYLMQFFIEYNNDQVKKLSLAYSDIENDIINVKGFADPGEAPINAISYLDASTRNMYTFVCVQDNVPHVDPSHKKYDFYEKLRTRFKKQTDDFVQRLEEFIAECNNDFDASYGHIDYNVLVFEDEESMLYAYWDVVDKCDNDYIEFWNAPYDVSNLCERPVKAFGIDPNDMISSKEFGKRQVFWKEDKNANAHKRKHIFNTFTRATILDQMVIYAGIRSGRGKLPSLKLNAIAKNELKDEKLDYSEYGNIRMFPYYDFWKFIKYNIKDVLLQFGIDNKVHDTDAIYATIHIDCVKPSEVFTSTLVVGNSLRLFAFIEKGNVMGSNKNKLFKVKKTAEQIKQEKKDKFAGAWVMHPKHCSSTGFKLLGQLNKYIHDHAIDFDITSEYPSGMQVMNSCNETLVGKVFLVHPEDIELTFYENMYLVDPDDEVGYKKTADVSNLMMEGISEDDPVTFGRTFFKLPGFTDIAEYVEDNIDSFL